MDTGIVLGLPQLLFNSTVDKSSNPWWLQFISSAVKSNNCAINLMPSSLSALQRQAQPPILTLPNTWPVDMCPIFYCLLKELIKPVNVRFTNGPRYSKCKILHIEDLRRYCLNRSQFYRKDCGHRISWYFTEVC